MAYHCVDRCELNIGDRIENQYVIEKVLGEGSFGRVYRVKNTDGSVYALKLLHLWDVSPDIRQPLKDRFIMEFKTGQIDSEYLVQSVDYGEIKGNPYIVMEFCPGGDLTPYLGKDKPEVPLICRQILLGLRALHLNGKVHRDLKPENVLFKTDGKAALTDFGIAGDRNRRMTERNIFGRPNQIFGTYAYMPPEQVNRQRGGVTVLPTTDIFSFGVLAFQLLTGKLPFGELTSHNELANYQKRGKNGDWNRQLLMGKKNVNQWIQLFEGCLNPNLKKRFQSVDEVMKHLPIDSNLDILMKPEIEKPTGKNNNVPHLRVMQGNQYGNIFKLSDFVAKGVRIITIGRENNNSIVLKDDPDFYISRHHCCIEAHSVLSWIIRDGQWNREMGQWVNSSNGTYVNSTQVTSTGYILQVGDIISIGDIKIRFEIN